MVIFIKTFQVILALSVLIIIHEFGHYLWARLFKIRVEKFYLFFDLGGKALARWHWGGTEFGIGWLPFGGYCKIAGMIDESMDLEQMKQEPKPWEFRSHPAWQRLLVMAGGVNYLVETKGDERVQDRNVQRKRLAATEWCRKLTDTGLAGEWQYVIVSENSFYGLQRAHATFADMMDRCTINTATVQGELAF